LDLFDSSTAPERLSSPKLALNLSPMLLLVVAELAPKATASVATMPAGTTSM